jgi:uncharacterized protein
MTAEDSAERSRAGVSDPEVQVRVVDADVHPTVASELLVEHIPEPWRSRYYSGPLDEIEMTAPNYTPPGKTLRTDAAPPGGGLPGSDPAYLERQLLRDCGVDFAQMIFLQPRPKPTHPELESAVFAGLNRFMAETWLGPWNRHGRFRAAIRVSPYDPEGAVREIERWAGHQYVNGVYVVPEASAPFGQPQFFPIFEAAARHDLGICMHITRTPGMRLLTPAGHPSYHIEIFGQWPLYLFSHIASLVFEGVFERLPGLRIVCQEAGFSWLPALMWRLDNHWRALSAEVPQVKRAPSEYIREQMRFTTQPLEEPVPGESLLKVMDWLGAEDVLMFASDYPHYDYDDPQWILPRLPKAARERILCQNAVEFFRLPRTRPRDELDAEPDAAR